MNRPSSIEYLGNQDLLNCRKWGFIASRTIPSDEVLRCYDWVTERAAASDCVVSGFSSRLEHDVLHFLLRGKGKVIIVLARRMYKVIPEEWQKPLSEGRMLIISTTSPMEPGRMRECVYALVKIHEVPLWCAVGLADNYRRIIAEGSPKKQ